MGHRHLACGATGRLAWLRVFLGRQDARLPHSQDGCAPAFELSLSFVPDQFVQSGNIEFQIEAFDSGESTFDIAREQLGIFG